MTAVDLAREVEQLKRDVEDVEAERDDAEDKLEEAEREAHEANAAADFANERFDGLTSSLRRHVWRDDRPGATYCVLCERSWPLHWHDCVFGDVI